METNEPIAKREVRRKLENGSSVLYRKTPKGNKVITYAPDGNPWSVITVREGYTLEEFHRYCKNMARTLKTKLFPWDKPAQVIHPDIIPA